MNFPKVLINDLGIRPAGKPDACFYCQSKVGEEHKPDCVMVSKKVHIQFKFEMAVSVPHDWDEHMINFRYNESGWCADNFIETLEKIKSQCSYGCLCPIVSAEFKNIIDDTPKVTDDKWEPYEQPPAESARGREGEK